MNIMDARRLDRQGYSLIELLTVMVVFAILVQFALPSMSGMMRVFRSGQASDQVTADLSYARLLAIRSGEGATFVFDSPHGYRVKEGTEPDATVRKTVDLRNDYGRVELSSHTGVDSIVFNSRGMATIGAGRLSVEATSDHTVRRDTLWLSPLGMVRREG